MHRTALIWLIIGIGIGIGTERWILRLDENYAPEVHSVGPAQTPAEQARPGRGDTATKIQATVGIPERLPSPPQPMGTEASNTQRLSEKLESSGNTAPASVQTVSPPVTRRRLENLRYQEQVDAFLREVRQDNLFETVRTARPIATVEGTLADMEGRFVGDIALPEKTERWGITLEGRFRSGGKEVRGRTLVALSRRGKVFSRHTGNGPIHPTISAISEGGGLLVQSSPTSYLQLFFVPGDQMLVGNYYEQDSLGVFLPKGTARLTRE
jgi:hypothetical protein